LGPSALPPPAAPMAEVTSQRKLKVQASFFKAPAWAARPQKGIRLDVVKGGQVVGKHEVDEDAYFLFGRLEHVVDYVLFHRTVSRVHFAIVHHKSGSCFIVDLDSSHGTKVNGVRLPPNSPTKLQPGDKVQVGESSRFYVLRVPTAGAEGSAGDAGPKQRQPDPTITHRRDSALKQTIEKEERERKEREEKDRREKEERERREAEDRARREREREETERRAREERLKGELEAKRERDEEERMERLELERLERLAKEREEQRREEPPARKAAPVGPDSGVHKSGPVECDSSSKDKEAADEGAKEPKVTKEGGAQEAESSRAKDPSISAPRPPEPNGDATPKRRGARAPEADPPAKRPHTEAAAAPAPKGPASSAASDTADSAAESGTDSAAAAAAAAAKAQEKARAKRWLGLAKKLLLPVFETKAIDREQYKTILGDVMRQPFDRFGDAASNFAALKEALDTRLAADGLTHAAEDRRNAAFRELLGSLGDPPAPAAPRSSGGHSPEAKSSRRSDSSAPVPTPKEADRKPKATKAPKEEPAKAKEPPAKSTRSKEAKSPADAKAKDEAVKRETRSAKGSGEKAKDSDGDRKSDGRKAGKDDPADSSTKSRDSGKSKR